MAKVLEHCDRAVYLNQGTIVADGDPREVVDLYTSTFTSEEVVSAR